MTQGDTTSFGGAATGAGQSPVAAVAGGAFQIILPPLPELSGGGDEMYDSIMSQIEPELMSANLPFLAERYGNETPEAKQEHMERYQRAFEEYDKRSKELNASLDERVRVYMRTAIRSLEGASQSLEEEDIDTLESQMLLAS